MLLHALPANRFTAKAAPLNHYSISICAPSASKRSRHSLSRKGTLVSYSISSSFVVDIRQQKTSVRSKVSRTSKFRIMSVSVHLVTSVRGNVFNAPSFSLWLNSSTMLKSAKNREEQEPMQVMDHKYKVKATFSSDSSQKPIKVMDPIWWLKSSSWPNQMSSKLVGSVRKEIKRMSSVISMILKAQRLWSRHREPWLMRFNVDPGGVSEFRRCCNTFLQLMDRQASFFACLLSILSYKMQSSSACSDTCWRKLQTEAAVKVHHCIERHGLS